MNRFKFTPKDDERLKELVKKYGSENSDFHTIGKEMNLTARQCKERWTLYLDPQINRKIWTDEEDEQLLLMLSDFGNKWALIAEKLNRTTIQIKNRFIYLKRKVDREHRKMMKLFEDSKVRTNQCFDQSFPERIPKETPITYECIHSPIYQEDMFETFE